MSECEQSTKQANKKSVRREKVLNLIKKENHHTSNEKKDVVTGEIKYNCLTFESARTALDFRKKICMNEGKALTD